MKRKMNLLLVSIATLFVGVIITKAAITIPVQLPTGSDKYSCKTSESSDGTKKITTCDIGGTATKTTTLSGTGKWSVKYNDPTLNNSFKIIDSNGLGVAQNVVPTSDGGTFEFTYSGNITKGEKVVLFQIEFTADNDPAKDCGGSVSPEGKGGSSTGDTDQTVDDEETGVSVPMMIIGLGAITGLAVYSIASNKAKMHRI